LPTICTRRHIGRVGTRRAGNKWRKRRQEISRFGGF
jgi:hypothetical protein